MTEVFERTFNSLRDPNALMIKINIEPSHPLSNSVKKESDKGMDLRREPMFMQTSFSTLQQPKYKFCTNGLIRVTIFIRK